MYQYQCASKKNTCFAKGRLKRKTANGRLKLSLKTPRKGRIPTGTNFKVVIGKASNRVKVRDVSLFGGSTAKDAKKSTVVWGLAVVVDFTNSKLEQYQSDKTAFNSVQDIREQLNQMENHWRWMSRGKNIMEWSIIRVRLNRALIPAQYNNNWQEFRDAIARQVESAVDIAKYDSNNDGVIDQV